MDAFELMSDADRMALADRLAAELHKPIPTFSWEKREPRESLVPPEPPVEAVEVPKFKPVRRPRKTAQHGTTSGYSAGCRCDDCRAAKAAYQRANSARLTIERAAPFRPLPRAGAVLPFERRAIASIDAARERAGEAL